MPHSLVKASPVERFRHRSLETLLTRPVIWCKFTFTMEYHKDNEEKSTLGDTPKRAPVGEKGCGQPCRTWSWSCAPTALFAHRLRRERPSSRQGVLAPAKAGFVRSRANQGGTTAKFAVLDLCQGRFFCCIARMIPSSGRAGWGGPPSPETRRTKPREKGEHREFTHHPNSTSE